MTGRPWELRTLDREAVAGLQEAIAEERTEQLEQEAALGGEVEIRFRLVELWGEFLAWIESLNI